MAAACWLTRGIKDVALKTYPAHPPIHVSRIIPFFLVRAVATQRRTYKNMMSGQTASSGMNMERARRLGEIGFEWSTTDPRHRPWEERYEELKAFVVRIWKGVVGSCVLLWSWKLS